MSTQDLIDYYVGLLIIQYASLAKASATIAAIIGEAIQDQVVEAVGSAFDLDNAVGVQLDMLGSYRGAQREIYGINFNRQYFSFFRYGQTGPFSNGFRRYGDPANTWTFFRYVDAEQPLYTLTDTELRQLIKFLAALDGSDYDLKFLDNLFFSFFGSNVAIFDSGNMTITYIDLISDSSNLFKILNAGGYFPHPAGVRVIAFRSNTLTNFFGFQRYGVAVDPTLVGFSRYSTGWKMGSFIRYP